MNETCYLDKVSVSNESIMELLKEKGIAVIENYFSEEEMSLLKEEFDIILNTEIKGIVPIDYSLGQGKVIHKLNVDFSNLPKTKSIFYNNDFKQIADRYIKVENELNREIFVVKDVVGSKHHANDMHFDVVATFKFFIYLTDTNEQNGAFCCVPGSHKRTAKIREELGSKISYDNRYLSRDLPYSEDEVISVNGKAGTLIIFDTDVFHKAGHVSEGERLVMRGHTRPKVKETEVTKTIENPSFFKKLLGKYKK